MPVKRRDFGARHVNGVKSPSVGAYITAMEPLADECTRSEEDSGGVNVGGA